jgi:hypothetical protein
MDIASGTIFVFAVLAFGNGHQQNVGRTPSRTGKVEQAIIVLERIGRGHGKHRRRPEAERTASGGNKNRAK